MYIYYRRVYAFMFIAEKNKFESCHHHYHTVYDSPCSPSPLSFISNKSQEYISKNILLDKTRVSSKAISVVQSLFLWSIAITVSCWLTFSYPPVFLYTSCFPIHKTTHTYQCTTTTSTDDVDDKKTLPLERQLKSVNRITCVISTVLRRETKVSDYFFFCCFFQFFLLVKIYLFLSLS